MKKIFVLSCIVFSLLLGVYWLTGSFEYEVPSVSAEVSSGASNEVSREVPLTRTLAGEGTPLAAELHRPERSVQEDVDTLRQIVAQYFEALQRRTGPPIGNDTDLARVLQGRNPLRLVVVPASHPMFAADGRMIDRFGTPYHIHARSSTAIDIRSAGPDRKLFTADDAVSRGWLGPP